MRSKAAKIHKSHRLLGAGIMALLASCLNPIEFEPSGLGIKIQAEVTGGLDVRSTDYAVLWVINRTGSIDVENMTITRADNPEGYPKIAAKPAHGSTHASYHPPTDIPYSISITYRPTDPPGSDYTTEQCTGTFTIPEKYMPRAGGNYTVYLYRARDGGVIMVEEEMTKVPDPDDTEYPPEPPAEGASLYPLIVRNVTGDMNASYVDFTLNGSTLSFEGPGAKDETLNYLQAGQYRAKAGLYRASAGLPVTAVTAEKNVPIIAPNNGQSWHTLYMWLYKTKSGGTGITSSWPPNPNDAADVTITDIAGPDNGLLTIVNKSETGDVIKKVRIDAAEIFFGDSLNPSFTKEMEWTTVLSPGSHTVEFMPSRQNHYGITLTVQIREGEVTTLSYFDRLSDPDLPPTDTGYGSGLIKVVNKSVGVVSGVGITDTNTNMVKSYLFNQFTPPGPINYRQIGRIGLVGDADFPIEAGARYLIGVEVTLPNGYVTVERIAALKDQIVEIVIDEAEIQRVHGAGITLHNNTSGNPVSIVNVAIVNATVPGEMAVFSGSTWIPAGYIGSGDQAAFRVNSSVAMPITSGGSFKAVVALNSGGKIGTVEKYIGSLYDTDQTITINDGDVPTELKEAFVKVDNITGIPLDLYPVAGVEYGPVNLSNMAVINPSNASTKGPITWTKTGGTADSLVAVGTDGNLTVSGNTNTGDNGKNVYIKASIPGAGANKELYEQTFTITLQVGTAGPTDIQVNFLSGSPLTLPAGNIAGLNGFVAINPQDAIAGGIPVTHGDISWSVQSGGEYVQLVNSSGTTSGTLNHVKGLKAGNATVRAVIEAGRAGGGIEKSVDIPVTVTSSSGTGRVIRFIRSAGVETVKSAIFVKTTYEGITINGDAASQAGTNLSAKEGIGNDSGLTVKQTGWTGISWPNSGDPNQPTTTSFMKRFPPGQQVTYYTIDLASSKASGGKLCPNLGLSNEVYVDVVVPMGPAGTNKYFVFFREGDDAVRAASDGTIWDPAKEKNYYFYVDLDYLPVVERNGAQVLPIFYDDWHNIPAIGIDWSKNPPVNRPKPLHLGRASR